MDPMSEILAVLEKLTVGESVAIPGRGGWSLVVTKVNAGGELDFTHQNPDGGTGKRKFFDYTTVGNVYGAGKILQEPSLGVSCRSCGLEVDDKITGAIVLDGDGKVSGRFSWSNIVFAKKQTFSISAEGELVVNGASEGFLHAVFLADKNRLTGYVGGFKPVKPEQPVRILEMETLVLGSV